MTEFEQRAEGSLGSYLAGFIFSLVLTLASFFAVSRHILTGWSLSFLIAAFALLQAFIQIFFFLHLRKEPRPYANTVFFFFMLLVVMILVFGTLWIMYDLDGRVMPPMDMDKIFRKENIYPR